MPYNNYFPNYQPMFYPQQQPQVQQAQQMQQTQQVQPMTNMIWVQGEAGAKSYLVAPNTTVQLWDSERQTIYIKSADASGMPSIKTLDYTIREIPQNGPRVTPGFDSTMFATKEEVNMLAQEISALRGDFDGLVKKPTTKTRKEVAENE